jgi:putative oxidoreductase
MIRLPGAAVWTLATILAVTFIVAGIVKLEGPSAMRWSERFVHWGYPAGAQYVVGALEILAGLGLLVPRSQQAASGILVGLMIGAMCTHLANAEFPRVIAPLVLGGLAFLVCWSRRPAPSGRDVVTRN